MSTRNSTVRRASSRRSRRDEESTAADSSSPPPSASPALSSAPSSPDTTAEPAAASSSPHPSPDADSLPAAEVASSHPHPHPPPDADSIVAADGAFGAESKYDRLHHLLDQTSLFSKFLSERMPARYDATKQAANNSAAASSAAAGSPSPPHLADRTSSLKALVPPNAGLDLHPFQIVGIDWLISLYENGLNGILADEMGLGKTIQVIMFLSHLRSHKVHGPFLIVAPLGTLPAWKAEFARWAPQIPVVLYHGDKPTRASLRPSFTTGTVDASYPVVLTNYEIAMNDSSVFKKLHWKMLVVDEGHRLKNLESRLLSKLKSFPSENRLLLSGTPLQNNLLELWSLLHFLLPDLFSSLAQFQSWFDFDEVDLDAAGGQAHVLNAERDHRLVSKLHTILRPFVLRRTKSSVLKHMASKKEYIIYTPLTPLQRMYYSAILSGEIAQLGGPAGGGRHSTQNTLMQLRKIVNHPYLLLSDEEERSRGVDFMELAQKQEAAMGAAMVSDKIDSAGDQLLAMLHSKAKATDADRRFVANDNEPTTLHSSAGRFVAKDSAPVQQEDGAEEWETVTARNKRRKRNQAEEKSNAAAAASSISADASTVAPAFDPSRLVSVCGKLQFLDCLLPALFARGSRVLIFSQMTRVLDVLEDYLVLRGWNKYRRLDGSTKSEERQEAIDSFNSDPSYFVFLLSTRAGGLGINLASADTVVIFDSDWSPMQDAQAADRAHRMTQRKPVLIFRLLTPGTVEIAMHSRAQSKRTLEQLVLTKGKFNTHAAGQSVLDTMADSAADSAAMQEESKDDPAASSSSAAAGAGSSVSSLLSGVVDWRRAGSIVDELVALFNVGAKTPQQRARIQSSFEGAGPLAAAKHAAATAAATAAAAAAAAQSTSASSSAAVPSPSPPPSMQRNNSLKRKSSSRKSDAAAASASSAAPAYFPPALLSRLLERDLDAPPDMLPATPFDSGFELAVAQRNMMEDIMAEPAEP